MAQPDPLKVPRYANLATFARLPAAGPEALPSTIRQLLATELNRHVDQESHIAHALAY